VSIARYTEKLYQHAERAENDLLTPARHWQACGLNDCLAVAEAALVVSLQAAGIIFTAIDILTMV